MKKSISVLLIMVMLLVGIQNVGARKYTNVLVGPDVFSGRKVTSAIERISSVDYNTIVGRRTYFYGVVLGNLRESVCKVGPRTATFELFEDDVHPNEDELVKIYKGSFDGLQLQSIVLDRLNADHNIDSSGDPEVELYHTTFVSEVSGDRGDTNGPLITYQYAVD